MFQRKTLSLLLTTLLTAVLVAPASAAVEEGTSQFEIFAGVYFPDGSIFDENPTYGLRFGHVFSPRVGFEIQGSYYGDDEDLVLTNVDIDLINVDLDVVFFANPDSRAVFTVFGGLGWSNTDITVTDLTTKARFSDDSDSLTVNAGIGGRFFVGSGERVYLRLDGRARWFEDRDDDEVDFEATFGVGWVFGGR